MADVIDGEGIVKAGRTLIPPFLRPQNPMEKWMVAISVAVLMEGAVFGLHTLWACGWLGTIGLGGFATTDQFTALQQQSTSIQKTQLQNSIDRDRTQICMAQQAKNFAALQAWSRTLSDDLETFANVPGIGNRTPIIKPCEELVISTTNG